MWVGQMSDATIERHDGRNSSAMDAVISAMLNAKLARMTEADRATRERRAKALSDLAEMDGELLP